MKPNSVAMICVKYLRPSGWHSSIDINNTKLDHPFPVKVENVRVSGSSLSFGSIFVNNVMVSKAQPDTISFGPNDTTTSTVILYTVSARPDSRGYYHLGLPYVCGDIPLVVGYDASQLDASAFQDLDTMCFNFGVETSLVGISGANMTYVDISNETVHSTKLAENISIIPPLQQVKFFDTSAKSVRCNTGLQLIIKAEDGSPACVKSDTAQKLIERGWATNMSQLNQITGVKTNDPFGITALIIYHPSSGCLGPPGNATGGGCPPNNFYLKINSNSTAYLMGYNICDDNSCAKNNDLSILLPINTILNPNYQSIGLPVNLQWKYGDKVNIQLEVSPNADNKTTSLIDLGNSTIVS